MPRKKYGRGRTEETGWIISRKYSFLRKRLYRER